MKLTAIIDYTCKSEFTGSSCFSSSYGYKLYLDDDNLTTNINYINYINSCYRDDPLYDAAINCIRKIRVIIRKIPEITRINFICKNDTLRQMLNRSYFFSYSKRFRLKRKQIDYELSFISGVDKKNIKSLDIASNNSVLVKDFYKEVRTSLKTRTEIKDTLFIEEL